MDLHHMDEQSAGVAMINMKAIAVTELGWKPDAVIESI